MKQVGIVGWRGMVGSVLLQRMIEENDFDGISAHFFSTSSAGGVGPVINGKSDKLKDANSLSALAEGNDSNLLIVFYVQIMPDDFVMQLHRF
ncbi:putative aspartate-semialdehyde dehydrogenase [Klebsiella pneumoniae]|nr:putative aspartate-semialdehyde dehydrogenase [Klebsiella pneumoniae]VUG66311.1 putative aspartate-semialdehyde dehydrogenase [Klebsiella pneumoniae]